MNKLILSLLLITSHILYADDTYMCFPKTITLGQKVKDVSKDKPGKVVIKTTWYGKPLYMIAYKPDGKTVGQMFENTQTKAEWIQSDKLIFKYEDNRRKFIMTLDKGETPTLKGTEIREDISAKAILKCFKK